MSAQVVETVYKALGSRYGVRLEPLGNGLQARVYRGGDRVFKVYPPGEEALAHLEAKNMARAGLGERVLEVVTLPSGHGVLTLRYFPGTPFSKARFDARALASLGGFLLRLHRLPEPGRVEAAPLLRRMTEFERSLASIGEARRILEGLRSRVGVVVGTPHRFAHTDLWAGNLLLSRDGRVFVVDWARATGDDPARDLAILKTGSLDLLGEARAIDILRILVRRYPDPMGVWRRLSFWIPLTYLHDLHWFKTKAERAFTSALEEKLPRAVRLFDDFPPLWP